MRERTSLVVQHARPSPRLFFDTALDAFRRAERSSGSVTRDCSVAGYTARLRFAGPALVPVIFPALAHLAIPASPQLPDVTICFLDSASTAIPMPAPPWSIADYALRDEIQHYSDDDVRTAFQVDATIISLLDARTETAVYWTRNAAGIPYYERGAPCRSLLSWWLARHARQLIHAGAVGTPEGCVLLAGKGGTGKSNTALGCLGRNLSYLSDDYCAIAPAPPAVVHSVYGTGKVRHADMRRLPFLASRASNAHRFESEKALFFLNDHFPERMLRHAPLKAIVMPAIVEQAAGSMRRASAPEALLALAPSTTSQLAYAGPEVLRSLAAVVRQVPCYRLDIGRDGASVPDLIEELLSSCPGPL